MTASEQPRFQQVLDDYARLEPGEADTWNPLEREVELEHRVELLRRLVWALRAACVDTSRLTVLDVGCGNGRSTRAYLDLGLAPAQLTGLDLRAGALRRARASHPAIRWLHDDGSHWPLPDASIAWVSLCTVLSSVAAPDERRHLAARITRVLAPGGHVFFWDRTHALDFAGGDAIPPLEWFAGFEIVWESPATVGGYGGPPGPSHGAYLLKRS